MYRATPSFVFTESPSPGIRKDFYLANSSAACQRFLFSLSGAPYERYSSFRVVSAEGRIVTTDGGSGGLLLVRFPIGADMQVNTASVVIKSLQCGTSWVYRRDSLRPGCGWSQADLHYD